MSSLKTVGVISLVLFVLILIPLKFGPLADFNKARSGQDVASQSPLAAYVVEKYKGCLHPGLFSSTSAEVCKVTIAQLVKIEKGESSVPEAMIFIDKYEAKKLQALGIAEQKK